MNYQRIYRRFLPFFLVCYTMTYVPSNKRWFYPQFEGIEALVGKAIEMLE